MEPFAILSLLALCSAVLSVPNPASDCKPVTAIVSILSQYNASATSFCSSFISIPVKTVTSTNVVTLTSGTSTVIQTETATPTIPITATTTVTPTVAPIITQTVTIILPGDEKRDSQARDLQEHDPPISSNLTAFPPSKISSACSCLSIAPLTTTVEATSTAVVSSTVIVETTNSEPPVTATVAEATITASTTLTECDEPGPTFILKIATPVVINGTQLLDTYGVTHVDYEDEGIRIDRFAFNGLADPAGAAALLGNLESYQSGFIAVRLGNETGVEALHFEDPELLGTTDVPDRCSTDGDAITCTRADGATIWQLCPETKGFNDIFLGPTVGTGCSEVAIDTVPLCTPLPTASS